MRSILQRPHILFLWLALAYGLLFVALTPPLRAPDERQHLYRIIQFSQLHLDNKVSVPVDVLEELKYWFTRADDVRYHYHRMPPYESQEIEHRLGVSIDDSNPSQQLPATRSLLYAPLPYLTAIPVIGATVAARANALWMVYLSRFTLCITGIVLLYYAIRITPVMKWHFFVLALFPATVFIRSSVSVDPLTIGYIFLFTAVILDTLYDMKGPITARRIAVLSLLSVLVALSKSGYFLLAGLFFLLPWSRFSSRRHYIGAIIGVIILPVIACIGWVVLLKHHVVLPPGVDLVQQIWFSALHPFATLGAIIRMFHVDGVMLLNQMIGTLGLLDVPMSTPVCTAMLGALFLIPRQLPDSPFKLQPWQRGICMLVCFGLVWVVCLLASWDPIQTMRISKLQGRYFVPILLPLLLAVSFACTSQRYYNYMRWGIALFTLILLTQGVVNLYQHDYAPK
jgi:uncharacterized membrane protein